MTNIIPLEYSGHPVRFNDDGWINATDIASKFGKLPNEWVRLPETTAYIQALEIRYGKIPYVKTSKARKDRGGGTWLHPKLAVRFARWLSVEFEIWCDEQIDGLIRNNAPIYTDDRINAIFLLDKPTAWEKRFQHPFYQALGRMTGLPYSGHVGGCPSLFGMITAKWVYQVVLPESVYEEARQMAKDSGDKIHQYLKPDAQRLVENQMTAITVLANSCLDYKDFEARCIQAFGKTGMQMQMIYPADQPHNHTATLQ